MVRTLALLAGVALTACGASPGGSRGDGAGGAAGVAGMAGAAGSGASGAGAGGSGGAAATGGTSGAGGSGGAAAGGTTSTGGSAGSGGAGGTGTGGSAGSGGAGGAGTGGGAGSAGAGGTTAAGGTTSTGGTTATGGAGGAAGTGGCADPPDALHVSPTGSDTAAGTAAAPLRTVQHAVDQAQAGDTVVVHTGTYRERVVFPRSGTAAAPITVRAACGATPVLDGTGATEVDPALVTIADVSHITVEGLELAHLTVTNGSVPAGVWVQGTVQGLTLRALHVHDIRAENGGDGTDAHGIAIYGTRTAPIEDLLVEGCHVHDLTLGSSEAVVLNGNVRRFTVRGNHVHDVDNIAFDFIGWEGTCGSCPDTDPWGASVDRAREGLVVGNLAQRVSSAQNPAYAGESAAGCFYVDGGGRITLERNTAEECDLGIELASEHYGRATAEVTVRNNRLWRCTVTGIATGGYDSGTGPGGGSATGCVVVHNTIVDCSRGGWADTGLLLQSRNQGNRYQGNLIVASTGSEALTVGGSLNTGNTVSHNLHWGGAISGIAPGPGAVNADPLLVDAPAGDLHLGPGSPALEAGPGLSPAERGTEDHDGDARGNDIGADERG